MRSTRCSSAARRATPPDPAPRLAAGLLVAALLRRIAASGGTGMVLAKGDAEAGSILVVALERGETRALYERQLGSGGYALRVTGPADSADLPDYLERRRRSDPDLWVIELDGDGDAPAQIATDILSG